MNRHSSGVLSWAYTSWATTSVGTSRASGSIASNRAALVGRFWRAARNISGRARRAVASIERLVVSLSVPATRPTARARPASSSTSTSEASPTITSSPWSDRATDSTTATSSPAARRSAVTSWPKRP